MVHQSLLTWARPRYRCLPPQVPGRDDQARRRQGGLVQGDPGTGHGQQGHHQGTATVRSKSGAQEHWPVEQWVCLTLWLRIARGCWALPARAGSRARRGGARRIAARVAWGSKLRIMMQRTADLLAPRGRQSGEGCVALELWLVLD